jgi:hypothetical protein
VRSHFRLRLLSIVCVGVAAPVQAADKETRTFSISVDGKAAGSYRMAIQKRADGMLAMTGEADVTLRVALVNYKYSYRGTEVWKDGRLHTFESNSNDNGKKHSVSATGGRDGASVRTAGREVFVRGDVWLTTYWQLPPENARGASLALVDADTGKLLKARLEKIGVEDVAVAGNVVKATRYRVSGAVKADLWYDNADRLVRQESVEDGHKTVLELSRIQRD